MTVKNGGEIFVSEGAVFQINSGIEIDNGGTLTHSNVDSSTVHISGKFINYGNYIQNDYGILEFNKDLEDTIDGTTNQAIKRLFINKSDASKKVNLFNDLEITEALRLISDNLFYIDGNDLTIGANAMIYPDRNSVYTQSPLIDDFNEDKFVLTNGTKANMGRIIKKFGDLGSISSDIVYRFPIGTPDDTTNVTDYFYTPSRYLFFAGYSTFSANSELSMGCVAAEHPYVLVPQVSLEKYWVVGADDISILPGGYNVRFEYYDEEVLGTESEYLLCLFYRNNTYFINAGSGYGIEVINNRFRVDEVEEEDVGGELQLSGNWTAGQKEAVNTFFYSINDGDFFDSNSWSQEGYSGAPATTFPQTTTAKVFIGNGKEIIIDNQATNYLSSVKVQDSGQLTIKGDNGYLRGDTLIVQDYGRLAIGSSAGISNLPAFTGNIRTDSARILSQNGVYIYNGETDQITGDGLPDIVKELIIDNTGASDSTVSLSKSVQIKDSLIIENGRFHLFLNGDFSVDGENNDTTGREIIMKGGELVCQTFPLNYKSPVFEAGTVTFDGTSSLRIPSSKAPYSGEAAVLQYNNVNIHGNRGANTYITLDATEDIRIGGNLDISQLNFNPIPLSDRFLVTGSNVVFNGDGNQSIQSGYATPTEIEYRLKFHDLTIAGSGIKNIENPNDSDPNDDYVLIRNNLYLDSATLKTNDYNIQILNSLYATEGNFEADNGQVRFLAEGKTNEIQSSGIVFNDVLIDGTAINGFVDFIDSMTVAGNLTIDPANFRAKNNSSLALLGDFTNQGTFHSNSGEIYFRGTGDQSFTDNGNGTYYDIAVNKPSGNVNIDGDSLIVIQNNLELASGNIGGRNSTDVPNKPIIVNGTVNRSGLNPGHVDGRLRMKFLVDSDSKEYKVGYGDDYAPVTMDINGFGGAPGYVDIFVEHDLSAENINHSVINTNTPDGAALDTAKNVKKVWVITPDTTVSVSQRFKLGASRTYDLTLNFPPSDTVGRGNAQLFEGRRRDSSTNTGNWYRPNITSRNPTSIVLENIKELSNNKSQFFIVGEPLIFTYYSIDDGNFSNKDIWSTAGYNSPETSLRAPDSFDNIRIGDGKSVTLDQDHTVDAGRILIVEVSGNSNSNGYFNMQDNVIDGGGTFRLDSGAAVGVGHSGGLQNSTNNGNVRTSTREYNYNNHNSGHFVFNRDGNQSSGNGLPGTLMTLKIDKPSGTLDFPGTDRIIQVIDSFYHADGDADFNNVLMKIRGNLRFGENATFDPGTQRNTIPFATNPPNTSSRDTTDLQGVFIFNGGNTQYIEREGADTTSPIIFNRFTLNKTGGKVISKENIEVPQLIITIANRANLDMATYNKYMNVYDRDGGTYNVLRVGRGGGSEGDPGFDSLHVPKYGWVEGRLIRYFASGDGGRIFPVGTQTKYSPVDLRRNLGSSSGAVSGLIEVQAIDGNHPLFDSTQINENNNIQRYWEFTPPVGLTPAMTMGNRTLRARLIFSKDEPRGGADPLNDYEIFRLDNTDNWTNTDNINFVDADDLPDDPDYFEIITDLNTPSLGGNNIFSAASQFTSANSITLMVGEDIAGPEQRIFYSRNSGNWTDTTSWSYSTTAYADSEDGYVLNSNPEQDYPRYNDATYEDIVYIGDGDEIVMDTSDFEISFMLVEKSQNGMGVLELPGENFLETNQFVLKNGGKLKIGSEDGINNDSQTEGNIRQRQNTNIINYDWNDLGINNFEYIGSSNQVQNTGNGLPSEIASLTINYTGNQHVELENNAELIINDSLVFENGELSHTNGNRDIVLLGDFVNNSTTNVFESGTNKTLKFRSNTTQNIRGSASETEFVQKVYINKPANKLFQNNSVRYLDSLVFYSNTIYDISDNQTLTLGENGIFGFKNNDFAVNKMIKVSAGINTAKIVKEFPQGNNQDVSLFVPVGEDSLGLRSNKYNATFIDLNSMNFSSGNKLELSLRSEYPHPNATPGAEMLSKYWSINTQNIDDNGGSVDLTLKYNDSEIKGNILNFLPTLYRRADVTPEDPGWSFKLFGASLLDIDTLNKLIKIEGAQTLPNHDWTAANSQSFINGRTYWSISDGNWSDPNTWTNFDNSGTPHSSTIPALNSPGYFENDTVFISSNHIVTMDETPQNAIDSLGIGVTGTSNKPELTFYNEAGNEKSLSVLNSVLLENDGLISKDSRIGGPGISIDTLYIGRNLINNTAGNNTGLDVLQDINEHVRIIFDSDMDSEVTGEGNYESLASIEILKADSVYSFSNKSESFSLAVSDAVISDPDIGFFLNSGIYYHENPENVILSADGDGDLFLGALVGIIVNDGKVIFEDGLVCGKNSSVILNGGDLSVGNSKDENFAYESITIIDIKNDSKLEVAGSLSRRFLTSAVDFRIRDNAVIEVMKEGATTLSTNRRGGFDFGESNSLFTMTGGTVKVMKSMDESIAGEKDPDYIVNSSNFIVSGGTVQMGDADSVFTGEAFNIISTTPFWNLNVDNTYSNTLTLGSNTITVKNDLIVGDNSIVSQNGQNIVLGGDFTLDGVWKTGASGTRRFTFNGDNSTSNLEQIFKIKDNSSGDPFFNIVISKPDSGSVILSTDVLYPNSDLVLENTLEFSSGNKGIIIADTTEGRYVQIGDDDTDLATVQRFGDGHVAGELRMWISDGASITDFPVGTNEDYTPVTFEVLSGTGTPGLLGVTAYGEVHHDFGNNALVEPNTDIERYWRVVPSGSNPFALGTDREYILTTYYLPGFISNGGDVKPNANFGVFEHFRRTDEWPKAGSWFRVPEISRTSSSVKSGYMDEFGDYIIGEPAGLTYYSRQNGNWNQASTWSTDNFGGAAASNWPNLISDRVRIADNDTVTIANTSPRSRTISVEKYNGRPGMLFVKNEKWIRGLSFELRDSCILATDEPFGFTELGGPSSNIGAVRTTSSRVFGEGIYEYKGKQGQVVGDGPKDVLKVIIDNTGDINNTVSFSKSTMNIVDSLIVKNGQLLMGQSDITIEGDKYLSPGTSMLPETGTITAIGDSIQYFYYDNDDGGHIYNLDINKSSGKLILDASQNDVDLTIYNNLNFSDAANIELADDFDLIIQNANINAITNYASDRFIQTSQTSGLLKRSINSAGNYVFPVGSYENSQKNYAPAEANIQTLNTNGFISLRTSPGNSGGFPGAHTGITNTNFDHLKRYWSVKTENIDAVGNLKFNYNQSEVETDENELNRVARWRPVLETNPGEWDNYNLINFDFTLNYFETTYNINSSEFQGDWTLSNVAALRRIFFSRQNGLWTDNETWTFENDHDGPAFGIGTWPDSDKDSVVIGGGDATNPLHEVTLDQDVNIQGTALGTGTSNRGLLNTNGFIVQGDFFTMGDRSHLKISSSNGITSLGNASGNIQTTETRDYSIQGIYEYNGIENQDVGDGLPATVYSLIINNTGDGSANENNVLLDKDLIVNSDLHIQSGVFDMQTYSADKSSVSGDFIIDANAQVRIGGTNSALDVLDNYNTYTIDEFSIFNFYGSDQIISALPANLLNGFGEVTLQNTGIKSVEAPLLIRGNLYISDDATLLNDVGIDALSVRKSIINSATVNNYGIIEIGQ
jgi:hypothetical protein